jgi:polysaccharide chain length determinant protein (PEP-CTERM system associated)
MQELIAKGLELLRGAWRYRWPALALTWLVAVAGWLLVATTPDTFESQTQVYVDTESLLKPLLEGIAVDRDVMSQVAMMQAVMLSRPNLEKVAKQTDLYLDVTTPGEQERVIDSLSERIVLTSSSVRAGARRNATANTFKVTFEDSDPAIAHKVVQSLLDTFMEDSLGMKRTDAGVAQRFLMEQLKDYERRLLEAETRLAEFKKQNVGLMPGAEGDYYQRLQTEMVTLDTLRSRSRQVQERRNELQRQLAGEEPTFGLTTMASSGDNAYDGQIAAYQARIDQLLVQYTDKHPEVVALKNQIARLQAEKAGGPSASPGTASPSGPVSNEDVLMRTLDVNPVYQNMKISLSQADAELAEIRGQIQAQEEIVARLSGKVDSIPEVEAEMARLDRDYQVNKKQYDQLLQRLESARISEQADQSSEDVKFRVIEPPTKPIMPSGPDRVLLSTLVLIVSLGAGLGLALLLAQIRPVFSTRDALKQVTGLPVLGSVTTAIAAGFIPWYRRQVALVGGALGALVVVFLLNLVLQDNLRSALRSALG